ncbi:DUF2062 domain-containing protein [Pseudozobellia thermophila]|nr:DUF2062 domain-containing protein [Pseudozobellia thermophila]
MDRLKCCVLVPTYNNAGTLKRVLDGVLAYTKNIIVVNDGATDNTAEILKGFPDIRQVHLKENRGKGNALKIGFGEAVAQGYDFVITIDSDGQHFPDDIPVFLEALEAEETQNVLYIGSRNMQQADVPGKSSFGNKFSNFWFWFETGIWLTDTQCGFRLYPVHTLKSLTFITPKFEFEIEVIVRASWHGTLVKNLPVKISYDEKERVSHFRTVPDFTRISILNTFLVLIALFYIKPRDFFRRVKKKGVKKFLTEDILSSQDPPKKKAASIALGLFVGLSPFWGFQTLLVLGGAFLLKLNKPIAFAFSNVSLPPFIPFIVYGGLQVGGWILGEAHFLAFENIADNILALSGLKAYVIGSLVLAAALAVVGGLIGYFALTQMAKRKKMSLDNG